MPTSTSTRGERFHAYVERLSSALGHRDRHGPLRDYVTGLCLPGDRKSIEPMAARVDPRHVRARHQSMHHFVANAAWDDAAVLRVARDTVLAALDRHGPVAAWVVDDTGIPKKGRHSVGVARQYCGVLGKQENCQVAVSVSLAHAQASVPVVADAGYGVVTAFRDALTARGIPYLVGISRETTVWPPGQAPLPPRKYGGQGRPPTLVRRTRRHRPLSVAAVAQQLPARAWRTVTWRPGTRGAMRSRFAAVRVRPAHRDDWRSTA